MSKSLFTKPKYKSNHTELGQQEAFPKGRTDRYSIDGWMRKWRSRSLKTRGQSLTFLEWSKTVPDCYPLFSHHWVTMDSQTRASQPQRSTSRKSMAKLNFPIQLGRQTMVAEHNLELKSPFSNKRVDEINLQPLIPESKTRTLSVDSKEANCFLDFNSLSGPKTSLFWSSSCVLSLT